MSEVMSMSVWLATASSTVAHRDRECPRLANRPNHSTPPQSLSARPSSVTGFVEVANLVHPRKPRRTVKLCLGCGGG